MQDARIGSDCRIERAIIDRGCIVPPGTVIGVDPVQDRERFTISPQGIVLVTPERLGHPRHTVR